MSIRDTGWRWLGRRLETARGVRPPACESGHLAAGPCICRRHSHSSVHLAQPGASHMFVARTCKLSAQCVAQLPLQGFFSIFSIRQHDGHHLLFANAGWRFSSRVQPAGAGAGRRRQPQAWTVFLRPVRQPPRNRPPVSAPVLLPASVSIAALASCIVRSECTSHLIGSDLLCADAAAGASTM